MYSFVSGVCKIYEEHLKKQNPNTPCITYDINQLFDFLDQLADLSCLVYVPQYLICSCNFHVPSIIIGFSMYV